MSTTWNDEEDAANPPGASVVTFLFFGEADGVEKS